MWHLWVEATPAKDHERLREQVFGAPPYVEQRAPAGGRRPRDWGANDDEAEASSMRALAALKRA